MLKKIFFTLTLGSVLCTNLGQSKCPEISSSINKLRTDLIVDMNGVLVTLDDFRQEDSLPTISGKITGKLEKENPDQTCEYSYRSLTLTKKDFRLRMIDFPKEITSDNKVAIHVIKDAAERLRVNLNLTPQHNPCTKVKESFDQLAAETRAKEKDEWQKGELVRRLGVDRDALYAFYNCPKS